VVAMIVLAVLALAVAIGVLVRARDLRGSTTGAAILRWAALVLILAGGAVALPQLLGNNDPVLFSVLALAVPIALTGLPLLITRSRARIPTTWACALVLVALAVIFGLSIGTFMLPGALVLLLAAGLTTAEHHRDHAGANY
jgi:hypothetical protein